ncbi:hypothetical protein IWX47DRAFT_883855 [Phyllosticta citricarpa]
MRANHMPWKLARASLSALVSADSAWACGYKGLLLIAEGGQSRRWRLCDQSSDIMRQMHLPWRQLHADNLDFFSSEGAGEMVGVRSQGQR